MSRRKKSHSTDRLAATASRFTGTTGTSAGETTPAAKAAKAPANALQPMPSPRGCQMTSTSVATKISTAVTIQTKKARR